jgi:hypothetical protein
MTLAALSAVEIIHISLNAVAQGANSFVVAASSLSRFPPSAALFV